MNEAAFPIKYYSGIPPLLKKNKNKT